MAFLATGVDIYAGDLGTFMVPLGLALLLAAREPARHGLLLGAAIGANLLHALNRAYDALREFAPLSHWLVETGPYLLYALLLVWALRSRR